MTTMQDLHVGDKVRIKTDRAITVTLIDWDGSVHGTTEEGTSVRWRPASFKHVTSVELIRPLFHVGAVVRNPHIGVRIKGEGGIWRDNFGERQHSGPAADEYYGRSSWERIA